MTACPICHASSRLFAGKEAQGTSWAIHRCRSCGHGFVANRPVMKELSPLLNLDALTVSGGAMGEQVAAAENRDPKVIRPLAEPLHPQGGVAFLFPGEGAQYLNMLADLREHFPEVRECFEASDQSAEAAGFGDRSRSSS